jgi:hypothetical protein
VTGLIDLALPCRLISLKVVVGPERGATTLEELAAKAILVGRTSVELLAELFGLPRRLLLDVVLSLWDKGYVSIDMELGVIALSESAHKRLVSGESLQDAAVETEYRQFLFEPITGRILAPSEGYPNAPAGAYQAPLHQGIRESDLPADELLRAVQAAIRLDRRQGFRKNVLEVGFGHPVLRPPARLRWMTVPASVSTYPDSGRLLVTLTDARRWDARAVARMRQHMAALADAEPKHPFVQALRGQASQRPEPPDNVGALLDRFADWIARLPAVPSAQLDAHQRDLNEIGTRLARRVAELDQARASVTVVSREAGQRWALEDLISSARTQLLIAAPAIAYRALNPLLPVLRAALDRRVQLVVLWGRTLADSLSDPVRAAFDELAVKYRSRVLIADRSARIDACIVVQDGSRALVSSRTPLEVGPGRDSDMVSVLIEPSDERAVPPTVISQLLYWAREAYPYWQDGQRIVVPRTDAPAEPPGDPEAPPELPVLPEEADRAAVRLLADTWEEYRAALIDVLRKGDAVGPVVELVTDGENQEFLWNAARGARRLVVADDNIDPSVFGRLLGVLHERADVTADLVFHSTAAKVPDSHRRGRRADVRLHQRRPAARLVIADDEALIGSFSPLGDDGSRISGVNGRRQLGVVIRSHPIAIELAISAPVGTAASARADAAGQAGDGPPRRTRSAAAAALPLLVEARRERQHGRFGSFVAGRLAELDRPWAVLEAWEEKQVPVEDLRPAVAAVVRQAAPALRAASAEHQHVLPWIGWLLKDAWRDGRFVTAALIAGLVPDAELTPPVDACLAAVPIELGPVGEPLTDPLLGLSDGDRAAASVGGAGALAELMLWGSPEGIQGLDLLEDRLPPAWRDLAVAARRFHSDANGIAVPIPLIAAELSRWDAAAQRESDWSRLAGRIDKLEQLRTRFAFESGVVMHDALFRADGLLSEIRRAARMPAGSRQLSAVGLPHDARQYLNDLVADAGAPTIQWGNQLHFLSDIVDIVRSARALAATQRPTGAAAAVISSQACRDLAAGAAKAKDELLADANGLLADADGGSQPYGLPLRALLERLEPLIQWGEM